MEMKFKIWFADSERKYHHIEYIVDCKNTEDYKKEVEAQENRIRAEGGIIMMTEINSY